MALLIFAVVLLLVLSLVGSGLGGSNPRGFPSNLWFLPQIGNSADNATWPVTASTETVATKADPSDTDAGRVEARLAARLISGQLSVAEYQQSMARLAAADALSRPIVAPTERSP